MVRQKTSRWKTVGWSSIVFYAVCGLLLLVWPNFALDIANFAVAGVLVVVGIGMIISYVRSTPYDGATSFNLSIGIALLTAGVVLGFHDDILKSILPMVWGISLIIGGLGKLQMAVDLKRMHTIKWWLMLIVSAVSMILGLFSVLNPGFIATVATKYAGFALLVEAIIDTVSLLTLRKRVGGVFTAQGCVE